jgi:hypothetical protein
VQSKDRHILVRSIRRAEPDCDKLAKAVIAHVIEQHRKIKPDSVKWCASDTRIEARTARSSGLAHALSRIFTPRFFSCRQTVPWSTPNLAPILARDSPEA